MEKQKTKDMLNLKNMKIEKKLNKSFNVLSIVSAVASTIGIIALIIVISSYKNAMENYALPQGDIALFMQDYTESKANMFSIIGYEDMELEEELILKHADIKENTYNSLAEIEKTMVTPEGKEAYKSIKQALDNYFKIEAEIIELGSSTDPELYNLGQQKAMTELAPLYEKLEAETTKLMNINIEKEHKMEKICDVLEYGAIILMIALVLVILNASRRISKQVSRGIANPLNTLKQRLITFENGDISTPFPDYSEEDELGEMNQAMQGTALKLQAIFGDLEHLLNEMANGNFNIKTSCEDKYTGEFSEILKAINQMSLKIDETLKDIKNASENVNAGASNLAEGAQELAEGATEQAAAIEEIQASMDELTSGLEKCEEEMEKAYNKAEECTVSAETSQAEMMNMVETMERIHKASKQIESIIGDIEGIASQTNLLSLNAAIEASHAGDAGKGFRVVADEIQNLADQSKRSAINTRKLIEESVNEINKGTKAALKTSEVLDDVVKSIKDIANTSKELSNKVKTQVKSIEEVNGGIVSISEVIQTNSATAQESSATSEELSAQATNMDELVNKFNLRKE